VLLCILHLAGQVPGSAEYGQLSRHAFVGWLNEQLGPGTVRDDLIPDEHFASVKVVKPETAFPNRCAVSYGGGLAHEAPVQAMLPLDLSHRDLQNADLRGVDLRYANLEGANLEGANLAWANLEGAILEDANLARAYLLCANLARANLIDAVLEGANLVGAVLPNAKLGGANLTDANLKRADLIGANLRDAKLQGANLLGVDTTLVAEILFSGAKLTGARVCLQNLEWWVRGKAEALIENFNREGEGWRNVLKNIAGLHDDCRDTKRALMRAVVGVLAWVWTTRPDEVAALIRPLGEALYEDQAEYLRDHDAFSAWLHARLLDDGSTRDIK
jgi:hypothetical protein